MYACVSQPSRSARRRQRLRRTAILHSKRQSAELIASLCCPEEKGAETTESVTEPPTETIEENDAVEEDVEQDDREEENRELSDLTEHPSMNESSKNGNIEDDEKHKLEYRLWQPSADYAFPPEGSRLQMELEEEAASLIQRWYRRLSFKVVEDDETAMGPTSHKDAPELCVAPALVKAVRQMRAVGEEARTELSLTQWQHMQEALEDAVYGLREAGRSSRIKQEAEQGLQEVEEGVQFVKDMIHKIKNEPGIQQYPLASKSPSSDTASETQWDPMLHLLTGSEIADWEAPEHAYEIYHGMAIVLAAAADAALKRIAAGEVLSNPLDWCSLCEALMFKAELQSNHTDPGTSSSDSSQRTGQDSSQQSGSRLKLQQLIEAAPQ